MKRQRRFPGRPLAVLLACLCCAVPAAALLQRVTVHFLASFNPAGAPGASIPAEVGQFNPAMPPPTFVVVQDTAGGELKVSDGGTTAQTKLQGLFSKIFDGSYLVASWRFRAEQFGSDLVLRLDDATDQGILDCEYSGGNITINGAPTSGWYSVGVTYDTTLRLTDLGLGLATWQLEIRQAGILLSVSNGTLPVGDNLTVKAIDIIRPGNSPAGTFFVDELKATSYDLVNK